MAITDNLLAIKTQIPDGVTLVAVSKTQSVQSIMQAYEAGQRHFGENRIQEMLEKYEQLPKDIKWHMIGHVQSNKVKFMASFVTMVHGIDSLKLLEEINRQAEKHNRVIDCLLQVHIAEEETKFGFDVTEVNQLADSAVLSTFNNVRIRGLMGMATFTDDAEQVRKEFSTLKALHDQLAAGNKDFDTLSMGMSGDYKIAIECGSTIVRIGSSIFAHS